MRAKRGTYQGAAYPASYYRPQPAPSYRPPQSYQPAQPKTYGPAAYPAPQPKPASYGGGNYAACGGYGPTVQGIGGYTYCKPVGCPQTSTQRITTPAPQACPPGQALRYYMAPGFHIQGSADATFNVDSEQACVAACTNNQQPGGAAVMCRSADYNTQSRQCQIYTSQSFPPNGSATPQPDDNFKHYEKICVDASLCKGPYFLGPQMILIGYAQTVTTSNGMNDCLGMCVNAQSRFGFNCLSGMFYYQETSNNCILNSESRSTHPDLYNQENQDRVSYFEPGCANTSRSLQRDASWRQMRNRNVLQRDTPDFGPWTLCDHMLLDHKRFKKCSSLNPNKCTKDENICDPKKEDQYDLQIVHPIKPTTVKPKPQLVVGGNGDGTGDGGNPTSPSPNDGTTKISPTNGDGFGEFGNGTKKTKDDTVFREFQARDSGNVHNAQAAPTLPTGQCFPFVNLDGTKDCEHGTMFAKNGSRVNCKPEKC